MRTGSATFATLQLRVTRAPRFDLERLCITSNAARTVPAQEVLHAVARHATGDRGLLSAQDRQQNEDALRQGNRLVSVYRSSAGQRFYVITDASRELTTVLLPEDYRVGPRETDVSVRSWAVRCAEGLRDGR